jgi:c-di-GMP-binding flagellar brake protein YcgR
MPKKKKKKTAAKKTSARKRPRHVRERRQHIRVPTHIMLEIRPPVPGADEVEGVVVNLSLGGLAFESPSKLAPGTDIYVLMEKPLTMTGKVVHAFPNGNQRRYGVRFTSIGLFSERKLENHVGLILKKT